MTATPTQPSVLAPSTMTLAGTYAAAVLDLLADDAGAEEFYQELLALRGLLDEVDGFEHLLTAALLSAPQREELVVRVFSGRCSETLASLLGVLARNERLGLVRGIVEAFRHQLDRREGRVEVRVTTALPLEPGQRDALQQALDRSIGAVAAIKARTDPSLVGGMVIRVGDRLIDASVSGQLKRLRAQLLRRVSEIQ
jgi:F-type H+-transporting ATPase subunit delta